MNTAVATLPHAGIRNVAVAHNVVPVFDPSKINIPAQANSEQLAEILAQRQAQTEMANVAVSTGSFIGNLAVKSPTKALQDIQKGMVQEAILDVGKNSTGDLPKGFVKKMLTSGNEEFVERITSATSEKVISEAQKEIASKAAKKTIEKTIETGTLKGTIAVGNNLTTNASGKIVEEATKAGATHATASTVAKFAPGFVSGAITLGGAALKANEHNNQLLNLYADDIHTKLGVDIKNISHTHLHQLAATDPNGKYASLNSELRKEFYGTAIAGGVGGIGGSVLGTTIGTNIGCVISTGLAAVTAGTATPAATVIIPGCAAIGGLAGSMFGSETTSNAYKGAIGQNKETSIDAMRKLKVGTASAYEVAKVIIGDNAEIDEAARQYNKDRKALHELPPEEQAKILINKYPKLYEASQQLADKINNGELTNLVALTKINTVAAIEYGPDYALKAVAVENAANNIVKIPSTRISSQSVSAEPMLDGGKQLGTGVAGEIIAARNAAQGVEQSASRI